MIDRRALLLAGAGLGLSGSGAWGGQSTAGRLELEGRFIQGGFIIGRTRPGAQVFVDGEALTAAGEQGRFFVGLDRDCSSSCRIEARLADWRAEAVVAVAAGDFPRQTINGLPPATVAPTAPAVLERIRRESALKAEAYASRDASESFIDGFAWPLESYRVTSRWGAQRVLNGTPARPHYGIDLAAPRGTAILAPADGLVTLAQPDMHFEGGAVFIDHGQGLTSVYLHQSAVLVEVGQRVRRGQALGRVGATGRATGPHLCWRARWRDRNIDPSILTGLRSS